MEAAKASNHIGPSKFFSLSAVLDLLSSKPLVLCPQDEIGVFLKAVTSRKATSHEAAVSQILRALWGISFASMPTPAWAQREMQIISCPALSIFGVSTPEEFHAALQGESVANGFLNRFLAFSSNLRAVDRDPESDPSRVPAASQREPCRRCTCGRVPESLIQIGNPNAKLQPDILPWASEEAGNCYAEFTRLVEAHVDEHPGSGAYLARCAETAVRLATIRAAGRWGRGARVDLSDIEWGVGVAWTAGQALAAAAQDFLPQNERGEMTEKILAYVRRKHPVKPRDIQQFLKGRLRSKDIKDILSQLVEAGEVEWQGDGYQPTAK